MVEHHREWHCKNDKGVDPEIETEIEMKSLEESKSTKANYTSEHLLMRLQYDVSEINISIIMVENTRLPGCHKHTKPEIRCIGVWTVKNTRLP